MDENVKAKLLANVNKNCICTHYGPANQVSEYVSQSKKIAHGEIKVQIIHTKQRKTDRESYLSYFATN